MADSETPGMVFPLEDQPLAWRDESGNTAIITFHVAIVAIPPNCHSKLPGWARLGKGQPWADGCSGQPRASRCWGHLGKRLAAEAVSPPQKHSFQHLSHISKQHSRPPDPAYHHRLHSTSSSELATASSTPRSIPHIHTHPRSLRPSCRCRPSRTTTTSAARTVPAPGPLPQRAQTATTDGAPEDQMAP